MRVAQINDGKQNKIDQFLRIKEELLEIKNEISLNNKEELILECLDLITATWNMILLVEDRKTALTHYIRTNNNKLDLRHQEGKIIIERWRNL